ncbi:MAG TPA: hypothetical protein VFC00_30755 [Micromonosporaceae bacterium]|nr:hypothetical protein [Micromonosporaceae bacterium]
MAFPATALPVRSQLFIGGQWIDFADSTLIRDPITVRRGVPDWGVRPDPSRCSLSLRNPTGDLSPRLPTGPYYGLLGQNTPLRIVLDEADDDFNRTSSNGWGTSSSGHAWATSGGLASAYAVSAGAATISISAVNSARVTALNVSVADCDVAVTFKPGVVATGAAIQMAATLRYQDDSNMYFATLLFNTDSTVTAAIVKRVGGSNTTLVLSDSLGTYDASSRWRVRAKVCGRVLTMRAWDAVNGAEPSTFDVWGADNDSDAILSAGKVGTRMLLQTSNSNSLPVVVTTSDLEVVHHRGNGEVPVWPVEWDMSGNDVWTPITAAGILRRVNKNGESFSPLRRTLQNARFIDDFAGTSSSRRPVAYWPLEEETGSTVASSGVPNGEPMTIVGSIDWASVSAVVGSDALPDMMSSEATLLGSVPVGSSTGAWTVGAIFTTPTLSATWTPLTWQVVGAAYDRFDLRVTAGGSLELYGFVGGAATLLASVAFQDLATMPTVVVVRAQTSGADTDYEIATTSQTYTQEFGSSVHTAAGSVPGQVTQVSASSVAGGASDSAGLGHVFVFDGWFFLVFDTPGLDLVNAVNGYSGDQAVTRLIRLLERQEDIPFVYLTGSVDGVFDADSELLGPQRSGEISDIIDDVLVVDKGMIFEARDELAIVYMARHARYNQPVTLALDYAMPGQVMPPFRPVEDDRDVVNDLTIKRDGGASGRYEKRDGRKSVLPPPDGVYRNPRSKTLPLYDDSQPRQHAAFEVNEATWDEARYPSVNLNLARLAQDGYTTVFEQAKRLDVGGRLTVENPPAWIPPDTIDLHALHLAEQIGGGSRVGAHMWTISATTVPAGPYSVGVLDSDALGKLDSGSSSLVSGVNSAATSLTVFSDNSADLWTTDGAETPIPIIVAGETMSVSAIASSVKDTFTRSVSNGWGTADTGQAWSILAGTAANFAASGNRGVITLPTGDTNPRMITVAGSLSDFDLYVPLRVSALATGATLVGEVVFRVQDASNYYRATFGFTAGATVDLSVVRVVAGASAASVGSASGVFAYSAAVDVYMYIQARGSRLRVRASDVALTAPPAFWTIDGTDAAYTSGSVGFRAREVAGNTNVNPTVSTDNFEVFNPQTFTVTRSVNGVVKSHSAGDEVHVYQPLRLAL